MRTYHHGVTDPAAPGAVAHRRFFLTVAAGPAFDDLSFEWRRLVAEVLGTFLLVLVGAGAPVVAALSGGAIGRDAAVVAPALTVAAVILSIGAISGAHLNPVVSLAFWLHGDFPLRRIPAYVAAQIVGAVVACGFLRLLFGTVGGLGATRPMTNLGDPRAIAIEAVLTLGLVSTILGTASGAQNVGPLSALGVAGYIALAGLWSSPLTGASMNPVRSFAPDLVSGNYHGLEVYLAGPVIGMLLAVAFAYMLRGKGPDAAAEKAAQGTLGELLGPAAPARHDPPV